MSLAKFSDEEGKYQALFRGNAVEISYDRESGKYTVV